MPATRPGCRADLTFPVRARNLYQASPVQRTKRRPEAYEAEGAAAADWGDFFSLDDLSRAPGLPGSAGVQREQKEVRGPELTSAEDLTKVRRVAPS